MDKKPESKLDKTDSLAHITGGGIEGDLCRIIPDDLSAKTDLSKIRILILFKYIRDNGILCTFNYDVSFINVTSQKDKRSVMKHVSQTYDCYEIGTIEKGGTKVAFEGRLDWI